AFSEDPLPDFVRDRVGIYAEFVGGLGRRTGDLHLALADSINNPDFAPEPLTVDHLQHVLKNCRERATGTLDALKESMTQLPDDTVDVAALVLSRRRLILNRFRSVDGGGDFGERTRIHGDYRLNKILRVKTDYVILDFEGTPGDSLSEACRKQ